MTFDHNEINFMMIRIIFDRVNSWSARDFAA